MASSNRDQGSRLKRAAARSAAAARELTSTIPRFTVRLGLIASAGLLIALALMRIALFENLDRNMHDLQARLLAPKMDSSRILVIDVDEESIAGLVSQLGAWPYERTVYAHVTDFLEHAGVRSITYDIIFAEARRPSPAGVRAGASAQEPPGDDEFAQTLKQYDNISIGALAFDYPTSRDQTYFDQLARLSWPVPAGTPAFVWREMTLPIPLFAGGGQGRAGVGSITLVADSDGILRRAPMLHAVHGKVMPSLALATVFSGKKPAAIRFDERRRQLEIDSHSWPVAADGTVTLRYPGNIEAVEMVPFVRLIEAAVSGGPAAKKLAERVRDRRVFVGSSAAILGDYVYTPYGQIPGLVALALVNQMLEQDLLLRPANPWFNAALVLIALLIPLAAFQERVQVTPVYNVFALVLLSGLVVLWSSLLLLSGRESELLLPLLAGFVTFALLLALRVLLLYQDKQRLAYEKIAAEQAYQLKSQFISQMTHELRTPLTAIMGFNRLLGEPDLSPGSRERYADVVDRNSHHLITIINNMLDQSKIEAGQIKINRTIASIQEIVDDVVLTLSNIAGEKGLTLMAHYGEGVPPALEIDGFRVRQILVNLIGNAIKFTKAGKVDVRVTWSRDMLGIAVEDSGSGLAPEVRERIFEPFRQGSDEIQQTHGGTGLGLAISRNLCLLMGGTLGVESEVGLGSTFTMRIPALAAERRNAPVARADAETVELHGSVLLADDNSDIRDLVARYLRAMGLTVITAEDGAQAIQFALRDKPDVLLVDIEMPVLNGHEAIVRLREAGFDRPILALTAHPEGPEIERAMAEGGTGFVAKPVNRKRLYSALRDVLEEPAGENDARERADVA